MPAAKSTTQKLSELAVTFVARQKGKWGHEEWERIVARAEAIGFDMNDEARRNLGNILEGLKHFYHAAPKPARKKAAQTRKKATKKKATRKK